MSIKKVKGKYQVDIYQHGIRKRKLFSIRDDAVLYEQIAQSNSNNGNGTVSFRKHNFKEYVTSDKVKARLLYQLRGADKIWFIMLQIVDYFKDYNLEDINQGHVESYTISLTTRGLKSGTIRLYLAWLQKMFTKAIDDNYIQINHVKKVMRTVKPSPPKEDYLTKFQVQQLLGIAKDNDGRLLMFYKPNLHKPTKRHIKFNITVPVQCKRFIVFAINTGMRRGEIVNLTWDKVDLETGFICLTADDTKEKKPKQVPVNNSLRKLLTELLEERRYKAIKNKGGKKYVLCTFTGEQIKDYKTSLKSAGERLGLKYVLGHHCFRHTACTWMSNAGVPVLSIAKTVGHHSEKMTRRYAHPDKEQLINATSKLEMAI